MKKSFIAIYGITNLGKTTQVEIIKERCKVENIPIHIQKYPIYDLEPTGPLIRQAIKEGNPKKFSAGEIQALMAKNRFDHNEWIRDHLHFDGGTSSIIAEMYTGTGIAYGKGDGVHSEYLLALNKGLVVPDITILLDGNRFMESVESSHRFEQDHEKTEAIRQIHLDLAAKNNWHLVNANQSKAEVHQQIWSLIKPYL